MTFQFLKKKNTVSVTGTAQNPFLERTKGRKIWNDRYLNLAKARRHWQYAFVAVTILALILVLLVVKLATQSQIKPVVVELSKGMPIGIIPVSDNLPHPDQLIQFALTQFITNSRTVLIDAQAEKQLLDKTYAYSADETLAFLRDYYNNHNPFEKAATITVQVIILNCLKISPQTWQLTWDELEKSKNGEGLVNQSRWIATLSVNQGKPNAAFVNENPFGIYITRLSWAKIQTS